MSTPIPPALARLIADQERQIEQVPPHLVGRIVRLALEVAADIERRMKALAPGSYAATQARTVLAALRVIVDIAGTRYGVGIGDAVGAAQEQGAAAGRAGLFEQLAEWTKAGLLPASPARADVAGDLLDPGLLEIKEASVRAYGTQAIAQMRGELTRGTLAGETLPQMFERLARVIDVGTDKRGNPVFNAAYKAERIVRTEHSYALHRRQIEDFRAMFGGELGEWRKQLVATLDDRTGPDSIFVNGQVREIDDLFDDNEGRHYPHPPNRPNDREVMIFVPSPTPPARSTFAQPEPHNR